MKLFRKKLQKSTLYLQFCFRRMLSYVNVGNMQQFIRSKKKKVRSQKFNRINY